MTTPNELPDAHGFHSGTFVGSGTTQGSLHLPEEVDGMPRTILACDPGSTTGWAVLEANEHAKLKLHAYGTLQKVPGWTEVAMGEALFAQVTAAMGEHVPRLDVVIEDTGMGGKHHNKQLRALLENRIRLVNAIKSIPNLALHFFDLPVSTWRSKLGHHHMKKKLPKKKVKTPRAQKAELGEYMFVYDNKKASRKIVQQLFQLVVKNDNAAEAILVGAAHLKMLVARPIAVPGGPDKPVHLKAA